jgi:hypothetical protein
MASLALRSARPWRAMGMRDRPAGCANCASRLCGALCGSGRPTSIVCWWQSGDAGGAADRRRALATTGHRAAACDQHDTRRHTATSMMMMLLLRPPAAPRGSAMGCSPKHGAERSAVLSRVGLTRAESSRARGAPSQRRRSAERPTFRWSAARPARAGGAALRQFRFWGERWSSGVRGERWWRPRAGFFSYGVIAKHAALKERRLIPPLTLFAPNPRARGARRASDVGPRSDPHSGGQQRDPLEPAGRRFGNFVFAIVRFAANDRSCGRRGAELGQPTDPRNKGNKATADQSPLLRLCR